MSDERQEAIDRACDEWMATFKAFHATYGTGLSVAEITVSEESFDAGYKAASPTPLQAAALAALVAWAKDTESKVGNGLMLELLALAYALIAAEVTE